MVVQVLQQHVVPGRFLASSAITASSSAQLATMLPKSPLKVARCGAEAAIGEGWYLADGTSKPAACTGACYAGLRTPA